MAFYEKQMLEMSQQHQLAEIQLRELGFAIQIKASNLKKPPSARALCADLDSDWAGKLPDLEEGSTTSFAYWYSYLFRGASAFVHPTSTGIDPLFFRSPGSFLVEPPRRRERRILEICAAQLSVAIAVASLSCPELIDEDALQVLADIRRTMFKG